MNQIGYIKEKMSENTAKVSMRKHAACGECGACQHGQENMQLDIIALNKINANIGEKVEVDLETTNVLKAAFIMYVLPLIATLLGAVTCQYIFKKILNIVNWEMYSLIGAVVCLSLALLGIRANEKRFKQSNKYIPTIVKIIK